MTTLKKIVVDCSTGIQQEIELTPVEVAEFEAWQAESERIRQAQEVEAARIEALKVSARAKLVAGETLTADEAALIIG
jgi:hypothetical protein